MQLSSSSWNGCTTTSRGIGIMVPRSPGAPWVDPLRSTSSCSALTFTACPSLPPPPLLVLACPLTSSLVDTNAPLLPPPPPPLSPPPLPPPPRTPPPPVPSEYAKDMSLLLLRPSAVVHALCPPVKLKPARGTDAAAYGVEHSPANIDKQLKLPCWRPADCAMSSWSEYIGEATSPPPYGWCSVSEFMTRICGAAKEGPRMPEGEPTVMDAEPPCAVSSSCRLSSSACASDCNASSSKALVRADLRGCRFF
mmetsp:Transcript_35709/g.89205  ORF Transcript_35709/g.89205 Transcript_35709/m.89205 type:complete len:251 (-) Transcript_35709:206-958(-)